MYTYELGLVFWGLLLFFLLTNFNALQKSFLGIYQFLKNHLLKSFNFAQKCES